MQPNQTPQPAQPERRPDAITPESAPSQLERASIEPSGESSPPPPSRVVDEPVGAPVSANSDDSSDAVTPAPIKSPLEAQDGDNIEPAWVERADKIKEQQANDPYEQEEAAEQLSQEYLKERFNIDVDGAN